MSNTKNVLKNEIVDFEKMKEEAIILFEKYEKQGFHVSSEEKFATDDIVDVKEKSVTMFKGGKLIIFRNIEGNTASYNIKGFPYYQILTKNEKGEYEMTMAKVTLVKNKETKLPEKKLSLFDGVEKRSEKLNEGELVSLEAKSILDTIETFNETKAMYEKTRDFFAKVIEGVENGTNEVRIKAKSVCVDAKQASPEEVGTQFTVWSHGQVEKVITVQEDTVFLTTLDKNGDPIVDEMGNTNTYDMPLKKFNKKYQQHDNGHYVQDPTPMATIALSDDMIPEQGITLLPPNWGGYEGTLMRGGLIMLPFNPELSREEQIQEWKKYLLDTKTIVDWYPNNEPETYSACDKYGTFLDQDLRFLYNQEKKSSPTTFN